MIKIRLNILYGILILAVIVTLFVPDINSPRFSPTNEGNIKVNTELGVLHSECAKSCLKVDQCTTSESYKKGDLYYCECKDCSNNKDITLTSQTRSEFN